MTNLADRVLEALAGPPKKKKVDLARACGLKPPSVNDWCTGKTKSLEGVNLLKAAQFLGVNPTWLAQGVGPKTNTGVRIEVLTERSAGLKGAGQQSFDKPFSARAMSLALRFDALGDGVSSGRAFVLLDAALRAFEPEGPEPKKRPRSRKA